MTPTTPATITLADLKDANRDYRDAQSDLAATRDSFHALIATAIDRDHIPISHVAATIGLSKSRTFDILAAHYARTTS